MTGKTQRVAGCYVCNLLAERRDRNALDHMCDSLNFVASRIGEWLHHGRRHSYLAGHRHHCDSGPAYPGTKSAVGT